MHLTQQIAIIIDNKTRYFEIPLSCKTVKLEVPKGVHVRVEHKSGVPIDVN